MNNVTVWDLSGNRSDLVFSGISPDDALINAYMLNENLTSQLHNPELRNRLKSMITIGKFSLGLGDYATSLKRIN